MHIRSGYPVGWLMACTLLATLALFFHALVPLVQVWLASPEHGHGLLIPFVAAYIVWDTRDNLFKDPLRASWHGVALLIMAQCLVLTANLADIEKVKGYGLWLAIAAVPLTFGGFSMLRKCTFLLLLLFFALPLPYLVTKLLTLKLQLISTDIGVAIIRMFGLPVLQEGNVIHMGQFSMLVAEACSGLRYLFPLISIGLILAYFFKAPLWARLTVVFVTIPITIFMNALRIAVTGWIIDRFGTEAAEGFLHTFEGWVVFTLALVVLLAFIAAICVLLPGRGYFSDFFKDANGEHGEKARWQKLPAPVVANWLVLLLGSLASSVAYLSYNAVIPARETFDRVPFVIDGRRLERSDIEQEVLNVLQPDDYFIGDYVGAQHSPVNLYMAYYAQQRDGAVVHSPRDCLPAGGWEIESIDPIALPGMRGNGNRALIAKGNDRLLVYYWVSQQGRNYASELSARAALLKEAIFNRRTDAGLVRIIVPVGADLERNEDQLQRFMMSLAEEMPRFFPD